jgi:cytochrome b subunit of formate dehydrogenase
MNKKFNTVLFILGATVLNMILMILLFLIGFVLYGWALAPKFSAEVNTIVLLFLFLASVIGTYFLYHRLMRFFSSHLDFEKYFSPLFSIKKPSK